MPNYFEEIARRRAPTPLTQPFIPEDDPLPSFMGRGGQGSTQLGQGLEIVDDPNAIPAEQFFQTSPAPPQQPQEQKQMRQQVSQPVQPPVQQSAESQPVTGELKDGAHGYDIAANNTVYVDPAQAQRAEALRTDIASIINADGTAEQIRAALDARMRRDGFTIADLGNVEESIAYRKEYMATIPVGIQTPNKPVTDMHGEDKGTLDAAATGGYDSITLGAGDELAGAVGASINSVQGMFGGGTGESFGDSYERIRDLQRQRMDDGQHYHGGAYLGGQIAGGLATLPVGGGEAALARGGMAAATRLGGEGAVLGGVYGFNSGTGGFVDRLEEGGKGAVLGAVTGTILGGPANAVARRVSISRASPNAGREVLDAADHLNLNAAAGDEIRPIVAQTSQGGVGSQVSAMLEPTITGGRIGGLTRAQERFEDSTAMAARRVADDAAGGSATDLATAAERANDPALPGSLAAYADESEEAASAVYGGAARAAGDARIPTPATIRKIDQILAEWRAVPGGVAGVEKLQGLRDALVRGPEGGSTSAAWSVDGLRRLRTTFGRSLDHTHAELREQSKRLWGPLSDDIFRGLRVAGRDDAATLYRQADTAWAERAGNVAAIRKVIGKDGDLTADAVAARLKSMSGRDYEKLSTALNAIDREHADAIRGGLITEMGKALPSRATEPGGFSLESFATRWGKMSPQAKSAMFASKTVEDLDALAVLANAQRKANRLGNPSRSGVMTENFRQMRAVAVEAGAVIGGGFHPGTWLALVGSAAVGRLLATPGFARMMVRAGEATNKYGVARGTEIVFRRLGEIGRRYPAAAQDIAHFRKAVEGGEPKQSMTIKGQPAVIEFSASHDAAPPSPATGSALKALPEDPFADLPEDELVEF